MPYLRPTSIVDRVRYSCAIPDSEEWRTQLWGAIADLFLSWRWEGESPLEDWEIAQEYIQTLNSFVRSPLTPGLINAFGGTSAPDGYLACDGASYLVATYPELFDAIGYRWGGSGVNFNVPDLRDEFPLGQSAEGDSPSTGGTPNETLSVAQIPSHWHGFQGGPFVTLQVGAGPIVLPLSTGTWYTFPTGGGGSHNNMPPYATVNFIISTGQG